jgi:hypothetical protein
VGVKPAQINPNNYRPFIITSYESFLPQGTSLDYPNPTNTDPDLLADEDPKLFDLIRFKEITRMQDAYWKCDQTMHTTQ